MQWNVFQGKQFSLNEISRTPMVKNKVRVQLSDAKVSSSPDDVLVTHSLGSCIGVCLYDKAAKIGGMLHFQLPDSKADNTKAGEKPFMFADTGINLLIEKLFSMGASKKGLEVKVAGGAKMESGPKGFDIGKRNYLSLRKIMWKNGMFINGEDVGGSLARNMYLDISDGLVRVRCEGVYKEI